MTKKTDKHHSSARQEACDTMLKEALARPGIKEIMEIHGNAQKQYQQHRAYDSFLKVPRRHITSDRSSTG